MDPRLERYLVQAENAVRDKFDVGDLERIGLLPKYVGDFPPGSVGHDQKLPEAKRSGHLPRILQRTTVVIYVHIPFCTGRCSYCYFMSKSRAVAGLVRAYMAAVHAQVQNLARERKNLAVRAVYFGGGTPLCAETEDICRVLTAIRNGFDLYDDAELTLEAAPEVVTAERVSELAKAGFSRISLGIQSCHTPTLELMMRRHTAEEALDAARTILKVGPPNFNVDLIGAFPGQSSMEFLRSLDQCAGLRRV
jgi:oxygen-independent coproporphyrinogen III oxidase